jgi:hypothetical protein
MGKQSGGTGECVLCAGCGAAPETEVDIVLIFERRYTP